MSVFVVCYIKAKPEADHLSKDAKRCVAFQPGMAFRIGSEASSTSSYGNGPAFLVVANLKWGLLVWPLIQSDDFTLSLKKNGQLLIPGFAWVQSFPSLLVICKWFLLYIHRLN